MKKKFDVEQTTNQALAVVGVATAVCGMAIFVVDQIDYLAKARMIREQRKLYMKQLQRRSWPEAERVTDISQFRTDELFKEITKNIKK